MILAPKDSIHAIHGFNDRLILIAGLNFAAAEDRQISATRVNTGSPARRCSTVQYRGYDIEVSRVISGNESSRVIMVHRGNQQSVTVTSPSGSAKLTLSRR